MYVPMGIELPRLTPEAVAQINLRNIPPEVRAALAPPVVEEESAFPWKWVLIGGAAILGGWLLLGRRS